MEKYKEGIKKFLNQGNVEDAKNIIEKLLEQDYLNNKINESEYNELRIFLKENIYSKNVEKVGKELKQRKQENFRTNQEYNAQIERFRNSLKAEIHPIYIYKGEMGINAPERDMARIRQDIQMEER